MNAGLWALLILAPALILICVFYPTLEGMSRLILGVSGGDDPPGVIWLRIAGVVVGIIGTVGTLLFIWLV